MKENDIKEAPVSETAEQEVYVFPASFGQKRLWFLDQFEPNSPYYNIPSAFRLKGPFRLDVFQKAIDEIVDRHESLRTTFAMMDGETVQIIYPDFKLEVPIIDLQHLPDAEREKEIRRLANQEARKPFDLKKGPLARVTVLKAGPEDHVILLTLHHIISDGWSMGVLIGEISALYAAFSAGEPSPLPELPLQYADYAEWQKEYLQGEVLEKQLNYWKNHLGENPPVLELPTDRPRPAVQTNAGATANIKIEAPIAAAVKKTGQKEGATVFMTLLAAFKILLYRYSGQESLSVGTPIANRTQGETEGLIGLFINTLVLKTDLNAGQSFRELVRHVRTTTLDAYENQDLPFEYLVDALQKDRDIRTSPLFQVMFILQNAPVSMRRVSDLQMEMLKVDMGTSTFDITFNVSESPAGFSITAEYNTDLFNASTIERMLRHYKNLLEQIGRNPDQPIGRIPFLSKEEIDAILHKWNNTTVPFPSDACVHQLIENQCAQKGQNTAVIAGEERLTYEELNNRANRLARYLIEAGVAPEDRVGISLERSPEMVIGLLAILKSGAAYVPLDPNYPTERLEYMIEDSAMDILITQESLKERFQRDGLHIISIDGEAEKIARQQETNPQVHVLPENTAYIIYTSGSTGKPKGVMIQHRSVVNHNRFVINRFELQEQDRMLQFATINFDAAVEEIFPTLQCGAAVVLRGKEVLISGAELLALIEKHGLTILDLPTAYWHQWVNELDEQGQQIPDGLKLVILGGDKASPEHVARWNKLGGEKVRLLNTYGPTETTIICTSYEATETDRNSKNPLELPIGEPIANTTAYILDKNLQLCPVGVPGELHIGGESLARGYLNRPELTAEKFIPDPFSQKPGGRLYKTGDLVKYRPDGNIEFIGRVDYQLKIRGFRVEPGEIENVLLEHSDIRDAAVIARQEKNREKQLIAYLVADDGKEPAAGDLRRFLAEHLPEYMVPAAFVFLDKIPLTANGKVDRKALPDPDSALFIESSETEFIAPRTPSEEVVAELCAEVLGLESVGVIHNFFELGGHSLLATQLISRVNKAFEVEVPLRKIFEEPTVAGLARAVDEAKLQQAGIPAPPIEPVPRDQELPLSFAQHRLWFLDKLEPNSPFYNIPETYRVRGPLDIEILEKSFNAILDRHEILRTTFGEKDGNPVLNIAEEFTYTLPVNDISALSEEERETELRNLVRKRALQPIPLDRLPLFHLGIVKLAAEEHAVILIMHHIISDNWSSQILMGELAALYAAFSEDMPNPLPDLRLQYADYAYWQRNWLQGEVLEKQIAFWKKELSGAPPVLELPTDRPRPAMQTFNGDFVKFQLPQKLSEKIKDISHREGATLFMTLLAAFQALLYRYSGQDDITVGSPVANRNRTEVEGLIGFFVNTLVLRGRLQGNPSFTELIRRTKETAMNAYAHQELPFEKIVDAVQPERDMSHSPLFQVMFALQTSGGLSIKAGKQMPLQIEPLEAHSKTAKFDLTLFMMESGDHLAGAMEYNTDLFDRSTIERLLRHFETLLNVLTEDPQRRIATAPLLSGEERKTVLEEWNGKPRPLHFDKTIVEIFEDRVRQNPEAIAVRFGSQTLTYNALNEQANRLAHYLRQKGLSTDGLAGVCIERSPEMIVALLAVLKAGGAYVPVDPGYPDERIRYILSDAQPHILLTTEGLLPRFETLSVETLCLDRDKALFENMPRKNPGVYPDKENLAYMIYTSGSTGKPKGTLITHRGLTNYLNWTWQAYPLQSGNGSLVHSTIAFDATVTAVYTPLLNGKTVTLVPESNDLEELSRALLEYGDFSVVKITPAHLEMLSHQIPAEKAQGRTHAFVIGGENLTAEQIRFWQENAPQTLLFNEYGPTETVVGCVVYEASQWRGEGSVPIGRAIDNTTVYILNDYLEPVPAGVPGELYIGGEGVARGYHNRADLTAERFLPDPFSKKPGARMYKTGDLVKYHKDGIMEFLGRTDNQVKIRGYRIELGEIETALTQHDLVNEAVVLVREDKPGDRRLTAYYKSSAPQPPKTAELRNFLKENLPEYMIPAAFVYMDEFPLTANGKVDRRALPKPEQSRDELESIFVAPRTEKEKQLAQIWIELLGIEKVGVHDSFFELGGHSLIGTQLISRIRDVFSVELPLRALFENPTIAGLAQAIEQNRFMAVAARELPPLKRFPRKGPVPLSFAQRRLWFLDQLAPGSAFYNLPMAVRLIGDLDIDVLERALQEIVRRHEILRTTFSYDGEEPVQVIDPDFRLELEVTDLTSLESQKAIEATAQKLATEEAREPFDLELGPLFRVKLLKTAENEHVILYTLHHIISDGWSNNLLMREVAVLYEAFSQGLPSPLPELKLQFADYALWQRSWLKDDILQQQIDYWKSEIGPNPPVLHLPTDRPRPAIQTFNGDTYVQLIPGDLVEKIKSIGQMEGATLFMTLLAAFQTLLHRYSNQNEFLVGSPIANRTHSETEDLIGFFVNTLVLRADFSDRPDFISLLRRVREITLGAYAHQDLPFEQLVEILQPERDMSHSPLFQVMFVLQNTPPPKGISLSDISMEPVEAKDRTAKFDLSLVCMESPQGIAAEFEYNTDLFDRSTIEGMFRHFVVLLEQISAKPHRPLDTLPMLHSAEQHTILHEWNRTEEPIEQDLCIHQLFESAAQQYASEPAIVFEDDSMMTYAQLNQRANQLAAFLRDNGIGPEKKVAISVDRSFDMVIGLLGVLKAGGVYIPIDPTYPLERMRYILNDAEADFFLLQEEIAQNLAIRDERMLRLDSEWQKVDSYPTHDPVNFTRPDNLAYIIYTSGSTGKPKGTMLAHRGLVNLTRALAREYKVSSGVRSLQFASFSFDASVEEIFNPLINGGTVHLIRKETLLSGTGLVESLKKFKITNVTLPPSVLNILDPQDFPDLRSIISAGEACPREVAVKWSKNKHFVNGYGPTENTVCTTVYPVKDELNRATVPIGRPIQNVKTYVLDKNLNPLPPGIPGELYIGGMALARGYINRPDLTAERFLPNPFSDDDGARMYKTGDLVRWLPDGTLEFLGRIDFQVKIRGFRIELGEIESVLTALPQIRDALVLAKSTESSDPRLVAYFIPAEDQQVDEKILQEQLRKELPDYMVPAAFVALEKWPLTPNGKIDRRALPEPELPDSQKKTVYVKPRNTIEARLAGIWEELLKKRPVGVHDNFFELGGHSLLAMRLLTQIEQQFGKSLQLVHLFQNPTVEGLAAALSSEEKEKTTAKLIEMKKGADKPILYFIHPSGGSVHHYAELVKYLHPDITFYGIQAKGMDGKEEMHTTIEAMAAAYVEMILQHQPEGPYYLGSYSFGVIVAYEMAQQLKAMGHPVGMLIQFDQSPTVDHKVYTDTADMLTQMFQRYFKLDSDYLRKLETEEQFKYVLKKAKKAKVLPRFIRTAEFKHNVLMNETQSQAWMRYTIRPYEGDLVLFRSEENKNADRPDLGWSDYVRGQVEIIDVPGNHLSMMKEPQVQVLATKLNDWIKKNYSRG